MMVFGLVQAAIASGARHRNAFAAGMACRRSADEPLGFGAPGLRWAAHPAEPLSPTVVDRKVPRSCVQEQNNRGNCGRRQAMLVAEEAETRSLKGPRRCYHGGSPTVLTSTRIRQYMGGAQCAGPEDATLLVTQATARRRCSGNTCRQTKMYKFKS